jgi:hypothetical protein
MQPPREPVPAPGAQLTAIGLHVTVELPGIVRDLDVHGWQVIVVPFRVPANVHVHLSGVASLP